MFSPMQRKQKGESGNIDNLQVRDGTDFCEGGLCLYLQGIALVWGNEVIFER